MAALQRALYGSLLALCRSYNRWLAETWRRGSGRLRWVVVTPGLSLDKALEAIHLGKEHGACGIFMRAVEGDRRLSDGYCVIVQGVVGSGDRRWQAFFSQGPGAGSSQSGVIFRSTPLCSWYTHAALTMTRRFFEDLTVYWGTRQRGGGDRP